jgi:hypothetical protein
VHTRVIDHSGRGEALTGRCEGMKACVDNHRKGPRHGMRGALAAIALLALASLLVAGCGRSSSSGDSSTASEASAQFLQPGSANNKLVKFGSEAPSGVREEASKVLTDNLEARQAANFTAQCATLAQKQLEQVSKAKGAKAVKACPKELRKLAEPLSGSKSIRANQLTGPISALRVKGDEAYALFHGKDGDDYAVPMRPEGGGWEVAAIVLTKLGTTK